MPRSHSKSIKGFAKASHPLELFRARPYINRGSRLTHTTETDLINYTERVSLLMEDVVSRVPMLSFIDMSKVLVFARGGRTHAEGAYATCHCICLPASDPGYYFWRDRKPDTSPAARNGSSPGRRR